MSLTLHYHPLASYCWKVLIALYENSTRFDGQIVDLSSARQREALAAISPFAKFPALEDRARGRSLYESTVIIEYLARHYPGRVALVPSDADVAFEVRRHDRFFDLYVHEPMQKIVVDRIRPQGKRDALGVEQARATLAIAYGVLERELTAGPWAIGEAFTMADCAAAPALYYANRVASFEASHPKLAAYLERLHARPSFSRVFEQAQPYLKDFPEGDR
jgi:glutathione S-transferase